MSNGIEYKGSYKGIALDPCPFCGAPAILTVYKNDWAGICCSNGRCRVFPQIVRSPSIKYAIKEWNIRGKNEFLAYDSQFAPKDWQYPYED